MALNNDNNNECCKCTTPEYELILNEQGPQGRQGEKGEPGFTPIISVKDNTDSNYTLNILTQDGQITTPNLKANLPVGGATGQVLTKNSANQNDYSWQNLPNATTEVEGIARLATEADFEATEDSAVSDSSIVTPALFNSKLAKQTSNFVTLKDQQIITGEKTFTSPIVTNKGISLRGNITARNPYNGINPNIVKYSNGLGNIILGETSQYPGNNDMPMMNLGIEIRQNNMDNDAGLYAHRESNVYPLLDSSNVIAGSNITINKTANGITINADAEAYSLPQANATTLGGIKANPKTDEDTQAVNIDPATGLLYTKAGTPDIIDGGNANSVSTLVAQSSKVEATSPIENNGYVSVDNIKMEDN